MQIIPLTKYAPSLDIPTVKVTFPPPPPQKKLFPLSSHAKEISSDPGKKMGNDFGILKKISPDAKIPLEWEKVE